VHKFGCFVRGVVGSLHDLSQVCVADLLAILDRVRGGGLQQLGDLVALVGDLFRLRRRSIFCLLDALDDLFGFLDSAVGRFLGFVGKLG